MSFVAARIFFFNLVFGKVLLFEEFGREVGHGDDFFDVAVERFVHIGFDEFSGVATGLTVAASGDDKGSKGKREGVQGVFHGLLR